MSTGVESEHILSVLAGELAHSICKTQKETLVARAPVVTSCSQPLALVIK